MVLGVCVVTSVLSEVSRNGSLERHSGIHAGNRRSQMAGHEPGVHFLVSLDPRADACGDSLWKAPQAWPASVVGRVDGRLGLRIRRHVLGVWGSAPSLD